GGHGGPPFAARRRGVKFRYRCVKAVLSRESWTRARPKFTAEPDRQEQSSFATKADKRGTSPNVRFVPPSEWPRRYERQDRHRAHGVFQYSTTEALRRGGRPWQTTACCISWLNSPYDEFGTTSQVVIEV